jgi:hypothetical protein
MSASMQQAHAAFQGVACLGRVWVGVGEQGEGEEDERKPLA